MNTFWNVFSEIKNVNDNQTVKTNSRSFTMILKYIHTEVILLITIITVYIHTYGTLLGTGIYRESI